MDSPSNSVTACRLCQHYNPEGRRGGFCEKLDVPVIAKWDACSLAAHPFEASWQSTDDFNSLLHESLNEKIALSHQVETSEFQEFGKHSFSFSEY